MPDNTIYEISFGKLETKKTDRQLKRIQNRSITFLIVIIINLAILLLTGISGLAQLLNIIIMLTLGIITFILVNRKKTDKRIGQFIKWKSDTLDYRLVNNEKKQSISYKDIQELEMSLDIIQVKLFNGEIKKLDISDFQDYKIRMRIKNNLQIIANQNKE